MDMLKIIEARTSVRAYSNQVVEADKQKELMDFLANNNIGPFGNEVRFDLVDMTGKDLSQLKALGTYGVITNAHIYLAGAVAADKNNMEDFGYCMEGAILKATELGLGTCWLGGFLNRSEFGEKIELLPSEILPAVTPLGYRASRTTMRDRMIRKLVNSSSRKPFEELFFLADNKTPLSLADASNYEQVLAAVRMAPSASNKQPWRIIKDKQQDTFHLFLDEDKAYSQRFPGVELQRLDMGIAMCHFLFAAKAKGLKGKWTLKQPKLDAGNWIYIASWM